MNKSYKEVNALTLGTNLESVVNKLIECKENGELISTSFNGNMLYSDTVSINTAYVTCLGITKENFDLIKKKEHDNFLKKEEEFEKKIPKIKEELNAIAQIILEPEYMDKWNELVDRFIRKDSLFRELPLKNSLDIVELLNNGISFEGAKQKLDRKKCSGNEYSVVCCCVAELCKRGKVFENYAN